MFIHKSLISIISILTVVVSIHAGSAVKRVSVTTNGTQANTVFCSVSGGTTRCNSRTNYHSISADGRFVAFASPSDNLVPNDTNNTTDVFVKDRLTGTIVRAGTDSNGSQSNNADTSGFTGNHHPSISADGRFVAFESYANNLVSGDTNGQLDVFVKDLQLGTLIRITFGGVQGDNNSFAPVISGNGRFVAFISTSTNLYPNSATFRVYRFDIQTGSLNVVAGHTTSGNADFSVNAGASLAISADGRYVAFGGQIPGETFRQVYRRDLSNNSVVAVSVDNSGNKGTNHSANGNATVEVQNIDMTPDGQYVVFASDAALAASDGNTTRDVYLRDFQAATTSLRSRDNTGNSLGRNCFNVSISADTRFTAFDVNGVGGDYDVFIYDKVFAISRQAPYTITNPGGGNGNFHPAIADNGRFVSFYSGTGLLVPNDTNSVIDVFVVDLLTAPSHRNHADFDGEAFADLAVFRPSSGIWYWLRSYDAAFNVIRWGTNGDVPVTGDFDGDAKSDLAVFRPANGTWYMLRSANNVVSVQQFGLNGDKPVAADYDGDEKTDIAVFRPSDGVWYIALSGGGFRFQQWGLSTDKPTVGDFDGDGKSDLAVYRPANGTWYLREDAISGNYRVIAFGLTGDKPTVADYNGDGITDIAVYRPSSGIWYFYNSRRATPQSNPPLQYDYNTVQWGIAEDLPVPADFDGDGRADISVFRPSTGVWYQRRSNGGTQIQQFGLTGDVPLQYAAESN